MGPHQLAADGEAEPVAAAFDEPAKGSNRRARTCSGMPGPVSATSIVELLRPELGGDPELAAALADGLDRVLGEVEQHPEQLVGIGQRPKGRDGTVEFAR